MSQTLAPFSCIYSQNIPELLLELNCSLAISTYQAGKLIFISAKDKNSLVQLGKTVAKPMGVAFDGRRLAVAGKSSVFVYSAAADMAATYPRQPNTYDTLFLPRAQHFTGLMDIHDIAWIQDKLLMVNTSCNCLAWLDSFYNFQLFWKPPFITTIMPDDRCHLNGLAVENGKPKYVSMFSSTDIAEGWRNISTNAGLIMDIESGEIVTNNLTMPHTPRVINGKLYVLQSAGGTLSEVDTNTGKCNTVKNLGRYIRGMAFYKGFLFIAFSKIRENSSSFSHLPIAATSHEAGIAVIHFASGNVVGEIKYQNSVEEIYDLQVLPFCRAGMVNFDQSEKDLAIFLPAYSFWGTLGENDK